MSTPDQARAALTTAFIDAFPSAHPEADYFIDGQPQLPDFSNQTRPFAFLEVPSPRMEQSGMSGANPPKRYRGELKIGLFVREGEGIRSFFLMTETLENALTLQTISDIILEGMSVLDRTPAIGWQGRQLVIPYYFDYLT